jgi:hypothetical protein
MAWIKFPPEVVKFHSDAYMPADYWIEPSSEGVARVKQEIADELISANIADPYDNK